MEKKEIKLPDDDQVELKLATDKNSQFQEEVIDPMKSGILGPDPTPVGKSRRRINGVRLYHKVIEDSGLYYSAGLVARLLAALCDFAFVGLTFTFLYAPVAEMVFSHELAREHLPEWAIAWFTLALCMIVFFVFPARENGSSIGKRALGLRVVSVKNERLSFGKLMMREIIGKPIGALFGVGLLLAPFTSQSRTLHDYIGGTRVVRYNYNDPA